MDDKFGLRTTADRGIKLGEIGQKILFENDQVRVWEIRLEPGETIDFHIHYHPYLVVSLGGGENEIETIFGRKISTQEPIGSFVLINEKGGGHRLTKKAHIPFF